MSKAVMISINPPHTEKIFLGLKTIEWRHKALPTGKYYCYETKRNGGCGKVIGEFTIWKTRQYEDLSQVCDDFIKQGCVSREFIAEYCKSNKRIAANFIVNAKRYDKPKELSEFFLVCNRVGCLGCNHYKFNGCTKRYHCVRNATRPPQSYFYVEELEE